MLLLLFIVSLGSHAGMRIQFCSREEKTYSFKNSRSSAAETNVERRKLIDICIQKIV